MTKYFTRHIVLIAASALLLLSVVSCERQIDIAGETSSVQISVALPGNMDVEEGPWTKADGEYVDASLYEGVRTLRIIVTSGSPGSTRTILYNQKEEGLQNMSIYTTTIENLPQDSLTFYAIANEESLGMNYDDETITSNLAENHKLLFIDADPKHFPARGPDIVQDGIPMSGYTAVRLTGDRSVTIDLYRSVVKLALVVENATEQPVTLQEVSFGQFFGDRYYMFRDLTLDVPDGIVYADMVYDGLNIVIPGALDASGKPYTETLSMYFYPTHPEFPGGNSPFTIGLKTAASEYEPLVFAQNTSFFVRNTQVNLRARITTTMGVQLDFKVVKWVEKDVTVPPFE